MNGPLEPNFEEQDFSQAHDLIKQRQRFSRRPRRPADILSHLMARKGYGQTESANELETSWNEVVGLKWQSKTKVGVIKRGVLEIIVTSSGVNQQLEFKKKKLLAELQSRLPKNNLKDLRFRIGNVG